MWHPMPKLEVILFPGEGPADLFKSAGTEAASGGNPVKGERRMWTGFATDSNVARLALIGALALVPAAQRAYGAEFYSGKVIHLVVSQPPGGAYDAYARLIARHMGKHIPGSPTIFVDNMPGAGGLVAAKHVSTRAKPDGLTLGMLNPTPFLGHLLKSDNSIAGLQHLQFVGSPSRDTPVCIFTRASGIRDLRSWRAAKSAPRLGMSGEGAGSRIYALLLAAALDLPSRPIRGYRGSADIRLAMANGEIDGTCIGFSAVKLLWNPGTDFSTVLAAAAAPEPGLESVPSAATLAGNNEARALIEKGIYAFAALLRYVVLPPATAQAQVLVMRRAFSETMKDAEFLAGAARSQLPIQPISGEELEALVRSISTLPPALAARIRDILRSD